MPSVAAAAASVPIHASTLMADADVAREDSFAFHELTREIYDTKFAPFELIRSSPLPTFDECLSPGVFKFFMGGLCFEMDPHTLQQALWIVCSVAVRIEHIDLYTKGGRRTGCGTLFVTSEAARDTLLAFNRRLIFTPDGVWCTSDEDSAKKLLKDVVGSGSEYRGPRHPAVFEPTKGSPRSCGVKAQIVKHVRHEG